MNLNKNVIFVFGLIISLNANSQNKVCENSADQQIIDVNTIGKCAIEDFKKSNKKSNGDLQVSTRNRFVRKRESSRLTGLKTSLSLVEKPVAKKTMATFIKLKIATINDVLDEKTSEGVIRDFVRYDKVSRVPVFVGCANSSKKNTENCKKTSLLDYLHNNLVYPFDAAAEEIEGKVWVRFIVDVNGDVKNISTSGPLNGVLLEKEVKRLITLLPKFIPGAHNNDYVNVEYFVPVDFRLE